MNTAECFKLIKSGPAQDRLFELFDGLEGVTPAFMTGMWKGTEIPSGHPMDGLLSLAPWYGKKFYDAESAAPLIMRDKKGRLYSADPDRLLKYARLITAVPFKPAGIDPNIFDPFLKLFSTSKYRARVREVRYRGTVSAAMIYDHLEIIDVFRKIDENTVLGVMDFKGKMHEKGFFFILRRQRRIETKARENKHE